SNRHFLSVGWRARHRRSHHHIEFYRLAHPRWIWRRREGRVHYRCQEKARITYACIARCEDHPRLVYAITIRQEEFSKRTDGFHSLSLAPTEGGTPCIGLPG